MLTKQEAVSACLRLKDVYEDYPFGPGWAVMRHRDNQKMFAAIFRRQGRIWINLKAEPSWGDFWQSSFPSVQPAYHMNKLHWISVILDSSIPEGDIDKMIWDSYRLTLSKSPKKEK